jgi:hypothetical protein
MEVIITFKVIMTGILANNLKNFTFLIKREEVKNWLSYLVSEILFFFMITNKNASLLNHMNVPMFVVLNCKL